MCYAHARCLVLSLGAAMRRRSSAGDEPAKVQRRKTVARKSRVTSKAADPKSSSAAREATKTRLACERDEALQQQRATADENARLHNELRESLRQKTATADVLKIISRSTFDLTKVLKTLLVSAARLSEAAKGNILRPSETDAHYYVAANYRHTPEYDELQRHLTYTPGRGGVVARVLLEGKSVQIPDVLADPEYDLRETARLGGFRTILGVPLLRESIPIGVLVLQRAAVRPFTEKQIKLVETFADQAVIAIENTRLFEAEQQRTRELTESLEQQTATSGVLQVISSSPGDLQPVFETMLHNAVRICDAKFGNIFRWEGDALHLVATHNIPPAFAELRRRSPFSPGPENPIGRMVATKAVVQVADLAAEPRYIDRRDPAIVAAVELGGIRTFVAVPMLKENELIGALIVYRQEVRPFTDKQIALVANFASQAVIAIENTRLLNELRQRTTDLTERTADLTEALEQQTATSEILRVISSSQGDLQRVFESLLANATRLCGAKFGNLFLRTEDGFRYAAMHGVPSEYVELGKRQPRAVLAQHPHTPLTRMTQEKRVVHVPDLALDESYTEHDPRMVALVETAGARTLVIVPMLKDDELVGAIAIYRREVRPFSDKQIALLSNFAAQAVIAIENTRLLNELRESLQQQTATADVLKVVSSSPGDLQPVFQAMLENAVGICNAKFGNIYRWDGEALHLAATHNTSPAYAEARKRSPLRPGPNQPIGRMVATKSVVHVADLAAEPGYIERRFPATVDAVELGGVRTVLAVPMLKENELIGAFTLSRQEVRPFTDKQIALVTNFAAQAVIAIENARLLNELRQRTTDLTERTADLSEALEQQTATTEVLSVISSSPGELEPVFQAMLENAVRICDAKFGNIYRWDGELFHFLAAFNTPRALVDARARSPFRPARAMLHMVESKMAIHVADLAAHEDYTEGHHKPVSEVVELAGVRTFLTVPMLKEDYLIGAFSLFRQEVRPFTDKQIALVTSFAAQAVIAIENTRLLNELRQRTTDLTEALEQQTGTSEVLRVISSSGGELQPVFQALLENAIRICEAKFGALFRMYDGVSRPIAMIGVPAALATFLQGGHRPGPNTIQARAMRAGRAIHVLDIRKETGYLEGDPMVVAGVDKGGTRTIVAVPMLKDKVPIGTIVIYRTEVQSFTDKQIALLTNFAAQAVIAIENARLLNELRESLQQQTATANVLKVISRSTFDLETVLQTLVNPPPNFARPTREPFRGRKQVCSMGRRLMAFRRSSRITSGLFQLSRNAVQHKDAPYLKAKSFISPM